jgi:hypothetical protein
MPNVVRAHACSPSESTPGGDNVGLNPVEANRFLELCDRLLSTMIQQQREKVLRLAREVVPHIGPEDILNPHDFPQLRTHPAFEFEDGLLAGLIASHAALRAEIKHTTRDPDAPRL